jgi:hypothetical protein
MLENEVVCIIDARPDGTSRRFILYVPSTKLLAPEQEFLLQEFASLSLS